MSDNHEISAEEYRALAEFRYELRRFLHFSEQAARAAGLEPQQHQLLLTIKGLPEDRLASVGELAERLQIQHHSTVELVNRTARRGLIERQRDQNDQRRVLINLTLYGDEVLARISKLNRTELLTTAPSLVKVLNTLMDNTDETGRAGKNGRRQSVKRE